MDPNGIQLEFCTYTRNLTDEDAQMKVRFDMSLEGLGVDDASKLKSNPKR